MRKQSLRPDGSKAPSLPGQKSKILYQNKRKKSRWKKGRKEEKKEEGKRKERGREEDDWLKEGGG